MRNPARLAVGVALFAASVVVGKPNVAIAQDVTPGGLFVVKADAPLQVGKKIVGTAKKGQVLQAMKVGGAWIWTEVRAGHETKKGWINAQYAEVRRAIPRPPKPETSRPTAGASGDWPQFRGPNRDGLSTETGLLKKWPQNGPKLLWTARGCGQGYASVAVADGLIYTTGNFGGTAKIVAFGLDGSQQWTADSGKAWTGSYPGSRGTPAVDGGMVYAASGKGDVTCVDAKSGRKIWSHNIISKFGGRNIGWGLSESPLIDGDNLIVCPGGRTAVVALNKRSGSTVWTCTGVNENPGYASPIVVEYGGLRQIVTMTGKSAIGVDAKSGKLLWKRAHITKYDGNIPTPVYDNGHIFIDSGYGKGGALLKLSVSGSRASVREVWQTPMDNHHGGVILVDGYLYGTSSRGQWQCLDFRTGRQMHAERGVGKGSVTYADGMLYCLSEGSTMGLAKATPDGHRVISQFRLPRGGGGKSWAHPVVAGGRLYVRHADALFAFDIKAN